MSTAVATPAPAAPSFHSARAMMDDLLGSIPETPAPKAAAEAPPADPDTPEVTEPPSAVDEAEELAENEVPPADDDEEDEDLAAIKDGKKYRVNSTKMKRLLEASKMVKAVQEHFEPTPEALLEHYGAATSYKNMTADFKTADPTNITEFMRHWAGESPEGFATLAQSLPAFLARGGLTAPLKAIESQVQNALIQRGYQEILPILSIPAAQRTQEQKDAILAAQNRDYYLTRSYKKEQELAAMAQRPRVPQVDQREQRLNQQENNFLNARWNDFDQQYITGAKETALSTAIDEAFKPVEGKYSERVLKSLKATARADVESAINKRSEWKRNQDIEISDIQREFRQALKTNSKTNLASRIDPLVSEYRQFIGRVVPGVVKNLTPGATRAVVQDSEAEHERLARGARQTAPSVNGTPAPRAVKGENYKQALDRVFG